MTHLQEIWKDLLEQKIGPKVPPPIVIILSRAVLRRVGPGKAEIAIPTDYMLDLLTSSVQDVVKAELKVHGATEVAFIVDESLATQDAGEDGMKPVVVKGEPKRTVFWHERRSGPENIFQQLMEDYERHFQVSYIAIDERKTVHQLIAPKGDDGAGILPQTLRWAWNHYIRDTDKHLREEWRGVNNFVVKINLYLRRAIGVGAPREMLCFGPKYKCLNPDCPGEVQLTVLRHEIEVEKIEPPVLLADMCWMMIGGQACNHQLLRMDRWAERAREIKKATEATNG